VYSFGVVLWEILACATPREVLHRLQNKRQPESLSQRQYQRKLRGGGGGNDLLEAMACADNAGTVALQQRHRDGRCKLPICTCWPDEIQAMVKEALSNDPTKRPSMADLRFRLEEEAEKLGSERRFDVAHRRTTFRIDLTNHIDNTETGNGEESINNNNNDNDDNHDLVPAAIVLSNSMESRSSHVSSFQQLAVRV
jgi:serine/threonine protein kinase